MLNVTLFGQFDLRLADEPVALSSRPAQTLLAYLLLNRDTVHRRERLAGLLWPDSLERSARQNLRNALWNLRKAIGDRYLLADKTSLAFNNDAPYRLDVAILEDEPVADDPDALIPVVSVYTGDLLPDFDEEWVLLERERLRALFERRMQSLLDGLLAAGRWHDVQKWAERWIALGHVPEPAYRALMTAHAGLGDLGGVGADYRRCVETLEEELGVPPSEETRNLYRRLSEGDTPVGPPSRPAQQARPADTEAPESTLPAPSTPFVGRHAELAEIDRLLHREPTCRLLTLVGPGGIGKTRLALEAARAAEFAHGVWFVPLAPLGSSASLISAIADGIRLRLHGSADAREQLFTHLRDRELLLVLDNFEHLLSPLSAHEEAGRQDGAALVTELLNRAPRVKLLVTSRERLNLSAEWVLTVEGLQIPEPLEGAADHEAESFSAVQLFLQRARQIKRTFGRNADELACVARICRLVGGMPLAIELAAAWINVLGCREIYQEIERSLNFLRTGLRDYPERHRDIRAVFDSSWNMLSDSERQLFRRLSVFRGGFTRAAAEAIGGEVEWAEEDLSPVEDGTLQLTQRQPEVLAALARLVDTSFVQHTPSGRYEIHELMRQYGAAKLLERPEEEREARDNHARFYLALLVHQEAPIRGPEQSEILEMLAPEIENVRRAWNWAVAQQNLTAINQALTSYFNFCLSRSRLHEGEEAFAHLVDHLQRAHEHPQYDVVRGRALIRRAALCYSLGKYDDAKKYAEEGLATVLETGYQSDVAFAQIVLGVVAGWQGKKELAEEWLHKSLAISRQIDDKENMADALHELAQIRSSFGDYAEAKRLAQESLAVSRDYGRPDWIAHALVILGWAVVCLGEYVEAEACYREALTIFQSLGNRHGAADALDGLGWVAWCREDFDEAGRYYEQSLAVMRELGHRRLMANTMCDLAILANEQEDYDRAEAISREGLRLADGLDSSVYEVPYLCCLGSVACGRGEYAESRRYLREALQLAYSIELWPPLTFILYEFAGLLVNESRAAGSQDRTSLQQKALALELLTVVIHHPATWQAIRDRAARLQTNLKAEVPADVAATATAQGKSKTLHTVVIELSW